MNPWNQNRSVKPTENGFNQSLESTLAIESGPGTLLTLISNHFQTKFEEVARAFHQHNEPGRRIFLNLFLSDIILREEFGDTLRIFLELQVTVVETIGAKKRGLNGITDYTVGFGKGTDIFDNTIPREIHLVAVEAKTSIGEQDLWQCVAEAASLYKTRVDAGKVNKRVWGILSSSSFLSMKMDFCGKVKNSYWTFVLMTNRRCCRCTALCITL